MLRMGMIMAMILVVTMSAFVIIARRHVRLRVN